MDSGGGGGYDTGALEQATNKSVALQEKIYDQTRKDIQPWYNAGVGGINKLADLLGVSGGSIQGREQIYNELLPQYMRQIEAPAQNNEALYKTKDGRILTQMQFMREQNPMLPDVKLSPFSQGDLLAHDLELYSPQLSSKEHIDYDALNSAIEERLGSQGTPEGYGSLLERFDMSKFEEDPSYQFRKDEGLKAMQRALAAQGMTMDPEAVKALQEYGQQSASQEYMNAYNRYNIDQSNIYNRLAGIAGMGQTSTGQLAGAGQSYATNVGNLYTGLAGAQTNAQIAKASQPSMFSQILGVGAQLGGSYLGNPLAFI